MSLISARSLTRSYGDEVAVARLDLDVMGGEVHALVGLNGAGKTTLMRMLMGMIRPDSGVVLLDGTEVVDAPASTWARVGHLIETPFGYPELTVRENVRLAARLHGMARDVSVAAADEVISRFELTHWADRRARALSLGNRQRLGLACAMVHSPRIVVLDEPSNALDPAGVVFMRDLLRREAEAGAGILVSSHHLDELARVANRISVMHRGRLVGSIDPYGMDLERRFFDMVHEAETRLGGLHA
ncbi:MAG: ABC transporter ATP-binding protein [Acidimicrobiia bacterium]